MFFSKKKLEDQIKKLEQDNKRLGYSVKDIAYDVVPAYVKRAARRAIFNWGEGVEVVLTDEQVSTLVDFLLEEGVLKNTQVHL